MLPPWVGGGLPDGAQKGPDEVGPGGEEEPNPGGEEVPEINPFYRVYRYYSSADKKAEEVKVEDLTEKNDEFRVKMEELKESVSKLAKPDGSKMNPARTCRDIKSYYPESSSGEFWLDPNRGCASDAIKVTCTFNEDDIVTCVNAKNKIEEGAWSQKMTHARKWFSEDHNLGSMEYEADMSQLTYLSYLSREAYQQVTIKCKNQVAWFNNVSKHYDEAIHFMGTKRTVFSPMQQKRVMHEVMYDGCSNLKNTWDSTILKFSSSKFVRLPITDMAPVHSSDAEARFGVELGPVCFI